MSYHSLTTASGPEKNRISENQDRTDHKTPRKHPMSRLPTIAALVQPYLLYLSSSRGAVGHSFRGETVLSVLLQPSSKTCNLSLQNLVVGPDSTSSSLKKMGLHFSPFR